MTALTASTIIRALREDRDERSKWLPSYGSLVLNQALVIANPDDPHGAMRLNADGSFATAWISEEFHGVEFKNPIDRFRIRRAVRAWDRRRGDRETGRPG